MKQRVQRQKSPINSLEILGESFNVDSLNEKTYKKYELDEDNIPLTAFGLCNNSKSVILINDSLNKSRYRSTLLHEVCHLLISQLDLKIDNEENFVSLFSLGLTSVLVNNQEFLKLFIKKGKQ